MTIQQEYRTKLVEALRSGEYKQCRARLHDILKVEFCCLGVAHDVVDPKGWDETLADQGAMSHSVRDLFGFKTVDGGFLWETVPKELVERLRNKANLGNVEDIVNPGNRSSLAILNDRGISFDLIADLIESDTKLFYD